MGLDQGHLHPLHRASEISCSAGEHSMPIALLIAIRYLAFCYYSSPPSHNVASSWFDSDVDIFDQTCGGPNSERGSKAPKPLLREMEPGAPTSELRENCTTV